MADRQIGYLLDFMPKGQREAGYAVKHMQFPSGDGLLLYDIYLPKGMENIAGSNPAFWDKYVRERNNYGGGSEAERLQNFSNAVSKGKYGNLPRDYAPAGSPQGAGNNPEQAVIGGQNVVGGVGGGNGNEGDAAVPDYKAPGKVGGTGMNTGDRRPIVGTAKATVLSAIPGFDNTIPAGGQPALPMLTPSEMGAQYRPGITPAPRGFVQLPPMLPVDKDKQWENIYNFLHNRGAEGF